jgi:L-ribulose-5-phosphate 4-epimerase
VGIGPSRVPDPLDSLRERVLIANLSLQLHDLVTLTWGNVSGVDRQWGVMVIKPSGVAYNEMTSNDMVVVALKDGEVLDGDHRPSTDTPTHLALYREFEEIGGIAHTHSTWATAWAQAQREIPLLGTTHADLSPHPIPITRALSAEEIEADYEAATGAALIEAVRERGPLEHPAALARGHAPFCWGGNPERAVENAITLEAVAKMAWLTTMLESGAPPLDEAVRDKHFQRKHGPQSYYGQS